MHQTSGSHYSFHDQIHLPDALQAPPTLDPQPLGATGVASTPVCRPFQPFPRDVLGSFVTNNPEEMAKILPRWKLKYQQLGAGRFCGSMFIAHTSRLQMGTLCWFPGILVQGQLPAGTMMIAVPLRQDGPISNRGVQLADNAAMVACDGEDVELRSIRPCKFFIVVVEREQLEKHARVVLGAALTDLRKCEQAVIQDPADMRRRLEAVAGGLQSQLLSKPDTLRDPDKARAFEDDLLDEVLCSLRAPSVRMGSSGHARIAWEAEKYMREHLQQPITIYDLCDAVGAAERTLHLSFREQFGISPKAYLKMLRLNGVRHDLLHARGRNVTDVATKWYFLHFGWFSHDYRSMFGETPSDTLRHAH